MDNLLKALADETRLRIINLLKENEMCVCELEVILDMSQSNVSRHLGRLRAEKIISFERRGQWIHYRIDPDFIKENQLLYQHLKDKMKNLALFDKDLKRLEQYKRSKETCETLKTKQDIVFH